MSRREQAFGDRRCQTAGRGQPNGGHGRRRVLPWTVQIHLSAEDDAFRLVHTVVWDADPQHDFVTGLGFTMSVPMTDPTYNR